MEVLRQAEEGRPEGTRLLHVMDREGDIYDLVREARSLHAEVLIRSCYDRRLQGGGPPKLWDLEAATPPAGVLEITVPRGDERPSRRALLEVRYARTVVRAPSDRPQAKLPFEVTVVFVREAAPPPGREPVRWRLVTTRPVGSLEEAVQIVGWYALRWRVERFHYTLKSGCKIENLQLETVERLTRALAILIVVALILLFILYAARENPQAPATTAFTPIEEEVLRQSIPPRRRPNAPLTLAEAVLATADLGGYVGRGRNAKPGIQVLWRGLRALQDRVAGALAVIHHRDRSGGMIP